MTSLIFSLLATVATSHILFNNGGRNFLLIPEVVHETTYCGCIYDGKSGQYDCLVSYDMTRWKRPCDLRLLDSFSDVCSKVEYGGLFDNRLTPRTSSDFGLGPANVFGNYCGYRFKIPDPYCLEPTLNCLEPPEGFDCVGILNHLVPLEVFPKARNR